MFYSSFLSLISQCILRTRTFISSHVVMAVRVLGKALPVESVKTGDEIRSCSHSSRTTSYRMLRLARKVLFPIVRHTKMSSVFGTGQSTNSRGLKDSQMSKVRASSHDYPHVEKSQESLRTEFRR